MNQSELARALREIALADDMREMRRICRWVGQVDFEPDQLEQIDQAYNDRLNELGRRAVVNETV